MNSSAVLNYKMVEPPSPRKEEGFPSSQPPLVILHGLFGSRDNWMSLARRWALDRNVFLVDLPNHGSSPWTSSASYIDAALSLHLTIEEIAGECDSPFCFLGHSMGGKTVMCHALNHADGRYGATRYSLESIVVADIAPHRYSPHHQDYFDAMRDMDMNGLENRAQAREFFLEKISDRALVAFLLKNLARTDDGDFTWKLNLEQLWKDYDLILGWPDEIANSSPVPVLFLRGDQSGYLVPSRDREAIWKHFPRARIEGVKNAGHWLHVEQPEQVLSAVNKFLAE